MCDYELDIHVFPNLVIIILAVSMCLTCNMHSYLCEGTAMLHYNIAEAKQQFKEFSYAMDLIGFEADVSYCSYSL